MFLRIFRRWNKALSQTGPISENILVNQGRILSQLNGDRGGAIFPDSEFKVFSQWGEDGIIQRLVSLVPLASKTFIEFGVEDFAESNCRFLMMKDNWRGMVVDGSEENVARLKQSYFYWKHDLIAVAAFITVDNIDHLLAQAGFDEDIGILSIDIDGVDYWVLNAITVVRPRIVIAEYNAVFGYTRSISVPPSPNFVRSAAHHSNLYFGASLAAYDFWAHENGYSLVGTCSNGVNAFFIRDDICPPELPRISVVEAFSPSLFRESRNAAGELTYLTGDARLAAIAGLPVIDVRTGAAETI